MNSMRCIWYCSILLILLVWSKVNASPFDVRIDHQKVDITRDLIINTPRPRFSWKLRLLDKKSLRNVQQKAYQIQLQSIEISQGDIAYAWDSAHVVSSQSIHVPYTDKNDLLPSTYYRFRLRVWTSNSKQPSEWTDWIRFRTAIFNLHQYLTENTSALWIGSTKIHMNELRKEFTVPSISPIMSAIVYISGIGYYELYVNGQRVDPSRKLDPGWSSYAKRVLLVSFDLTANITAGANAVGVKLGNGWYTAEQRENPAFGPPRLLFTLLIRFKNGDEIQVVSDQTWTGREGSIKHDSIYNGEICDGRSDRSNWSRAEFNDSLSTWITPELLPSPMNSSMNGSLALQDMPPVRAGLDALHFDVWPDCQQQGYLTPSDVVEIKGGKLSDGGVLKPVAMWSSESGVRTFDLGQHMAGWCRVRFYGPSGFGTYIRYGESLVQPVVSTNRSSRNIYTENLRRATASDTYILRGDPAGEIYEPTFSVHGFRYLSIFGSPNLLTIDDVECPFVHSETTLKGHFTSSNPVVNQIQHNVLWGQLSNIMSIPTDCTQRDERRGWLADAALAATQALYNFDLIKFYQNYLDRIVDDQRYDGALSEFSPSSDNGSFPSTSSKYPAEANWATALPTITWLIYLHYQDVQTLNDYYSNIVAYVNYLCSVHAKYGLIDFPVVFGDWVPPFPQLQSNPHLITSFAFLHDVYVLINMSQILGRQNDTATFTTLYHQLAEEFHRAFFNTSGNFYTDGMQAAQTLALALPDVVPTTVREAVINHLVADINVQGIHVTTGIISTAQLYPVLSDNGHHDLALQLISSITYPSYGYMFNNPYENATTLWELWNTATAGPGMNSRNQAMYGSIGAWFYSHLAGIELSSNIITVRPRMASEQNKHLMTKLHCQLNSLYSVVTISYTRDEHDTVPNSVLLHVTIPLNAQGRVIFEPLFAGGKCKTLMEGDQVIWSSDRSSMNIEGFEIEQDFRTALMTVHIGSGEYEFKAIWQ